MNGFFQLFFCKRVSSVTVLGKSKEPKVGFKTLEKIKRTVKSDEFWNDRGRFYGAVFSAIKTAENADSRAVR